MVPSGCLEKGARPCLAGVGNAFFRLDDRVMGVILLLLCLTTLICVHILLYKISISFFIKFLKRTSMKNTMDSENEAAGADDPRSRLIRERSNSRIQVLYF